MTQEMSQEDHLSNTAPLLMFSCKGMKAQGDAGTAPTLELLDSIKAGRAPHLLIANPPYGHLQAQATIGPWDVPSPTWLGKGVALE